MPVSKGLRRLFREMGLTPNALNELVEHLENRHQEPSAKPAAPAIDKLAPSTFAGKTTKKKGPAKVD